MKCLVLINVGDEYTVYEEKIVRSGSEINDDIDKTDFFEFCEDITAAYAIDGNTIESITEITEDSDGEG